MKYILLIYISTLQLYSYNCWLYLQNRYVYFYWLNETSIKQNKNAVDSNMNYLLVTKVNDIYICAYTKIRRIK